jgi:hypothetical protein
MEMTPKYITVTIKVNKLWVYSPTSISHLSPYNINNTIPDENMTWSEHTVS